MSEFARTKEVAIWGMLYGFQQEHIDFSVVRVLETKPLETETLILRWHKNNPPKIEPDHLTCTLMFNMVPTLVRVEYATIAAIGAEGGVAVPFPVEAKPTGAPVVKKPNLSVVH